MSLLMRISVIIPSYNRAALVTRTLDSVFRQTLPPDEVIVVDDGSTDDTRDAIARYVRPVIYHYQPNGGLTAARDAGLRLATGDGICFLDSDDLLLPDALRCLREALEASPEAVLAYCRSQIIDEQDRVTEAVWDIEDVDGSAWEALLLQNFIRSTGAALIRRPCLERIGQADVPHEVADWGTWLRLAEQGPFARVERALFQYRVHGTAMSQNLWAMHCASWELLCFLLRRHRDDPPRRRALAVVVRKHRDRKPGFILNLAFRDRSQGRHKDALVRGMAAVCMRPGYLINHGVVCFLLGTTMRLLLAPRQQAGGAQVGGASKAP